MFARVAEQKGVADDSQRVCGVVRKDPFVHDCQAAVQGSDWQVRNRHCPDGGQLQGRTDFLNCVQLDCCPLQVLDGRECGFLGVFLQVVCPETARRQKTQFQVAYCVV